MTTYFVTRQPRAREWAEQEGVHVDATVAHLDLEMIRPGDRLLGSLPVNLARLPVRQDKLALSCR
jgi:CRISPR-associated protein Csx16